MTSIIIFAVIGGAFFYEYINGKRQPRDYTQMEVEQGRESTGLHYGYIKNSPPRQTWNEAFHEQAPKLAKNIAFGVAAWSLMFWVVGPFLYGGVMEVIGR